MKKSIILFSLLLTNAFANAQSLTLSVDRDTVGQNDYVALTVKAENCDLNNFYLPKSITNDFKQSGNPSSQTSMSIMNGNVSSSVSLTYYLQATKKGKFTFDDIATQKDGKTIKAEKIKVVVVESGQAPVARNRQQQRQQPQMRMPDPFFQFPSFPNFPDFPEFPQHQQMPQRNFPQPRQTPQPQEPAKPKRKTIQI